jgi:hypothetical protein
MTANRFGRAVPQRKRIRKSRVVGNHASSWALSLLIRSQKVKRSHTELFGVLVMALLEILEILIIALLLATRLTETKGWSVGPRTDQNRYFKAT